MIAELIEVKGIGRWTAEMFLIFHLGRPDVISAGDLGIRRAIQIAYELEELPGPDRPGADRRAVAPAAHARLPLPLALARQRARRRRAGVESRRWLAAIAPALVFAALALAAAGCGDDDDSASGTTTTTALTKDEFIREANRICKKQDSKIERASQQFFADAPERPGAASLMRSPSSARRPSSRRSRTRSTASRRSGAPTGDEEQVKQMLDAAQVGPRGARGAPRAAREGRGRVVFEEYQKLASAYGLDQCAAG